MKKYGLIGYPLKHSFSASFFKEKFKQENINATYLNFEIPEIELLPKIIADNPLLAGLNVTIPYKQSVMQYLQEIDEKTALHIGAVNVVKIIRTNDKIHLKGYNSDVVGFLNSIKPLLDQNHHQKALILGTGGAAKAVYYALDQIKVKCNYVSRQKIVGQYTYEDLTKDVIDEHKIIVNASPLGTFPNVDECPNIPYQYLSKNHLLYDLVYNPPITKFLESGKKQGAMIKNGHEMLVLQALAAWNIWNT